jgi:DNA-binding response OmpR family regulator
MKRRILLVHDDVPARLTLKAVLEMDQFEVHTAASAAEAMEKLHSGVYQMVIAGAHMETEDAGFHVVAEARKQPYNPATALLTAYPPHQGDWAKEGVQSLLIKPLGTQDLVRQIEALLVRHEDDKRLLRPTERSVSRHASAWNREGGRKVS